MSVFHVIETIFKYEKNVIFQEGWGRGGGGGATRKISFEGGKTNPIPKTFFKGGVTSKGI